MSPSQERKRPRRDERMDLPYRDRLMEHPRHDERTQCRERERPRRDERFRQDERAPLRKRSLGRGCSYSREREPLYQLTAPLMRYSSPHRGSDGLGQGHARQLSMPITQRSPPRNMRDRPPVSYTHLTLPTICSV